MHISWSWMILPMLSQVLSVVDLSSNVSFVVLSGFRVVEILLWLVYHGGEARRTPCRTCSVFCSIYWSSHWCIYLAWCCTCVVARSGIRSQSVLSTISSFFISVAIHVHGLHVALSIVWIFIMYFPLYAPIHRVS